MFKPPHSKIYFCPEGHTFDQAGRCIWDNRELQKAYSICPYCEYVSLRATKNGLCPGCDAVMVGLDQVDRENENSPKSA